MPYRDPIEHFALTAVLNGLRRHGDVLVYFLPRTRSVSVIGMGPRRRVPKAQPDDALLVGRYTFGHQQQAMDDLGATLAALPLDAPAANDTTINPPRLSGGAVARIGASL